MAAHSKPAYIENMPNIESLYSEAPPRAWAEINLDNLSHNYQQAQQQCKGQIMAVLKADAYGHGIEQIAQHLEQKLPQHAPSFLGVASVGEARHLFKTGLKTPLYLLGPTLPSERREIITRRWTACISSWDEATHFNDLNQGNPPLPVHLAVDTGMGRGGFLPDNLKAQLPALATLKHLNIEGIGSHLPSADDDQLFTRKQFELFDATVKALGADNYPYRHLANSAGLLGFTSQVTNLYRPGLILYGISPLVAFQTQLKPVMTLKSRVSIIRELPAGHGISYGRKTILKKNTPVATIGIGYGDGYPRAISLTGAEVNIQGTRCPILGRVTMDQIMVDVSAVNHCQPGDEVELFGENILVTEIAEKAGTIPWEILTGITTRVKRVYLSTNPA